MTTIYLTQTRRYRSLDGGSIASHRYVWRGPATDPVFSVENCRDLTSAKVDVVIESPCEAICVIERTTNVPGIVPSTMNGWTRWRIQGNGLASRGFWCRVGRSLTMEENNEHMEFHANWFAGVARPFVFEGQQCKHHRLTHNVIERYDVAVSADTAFHWQGGTIAVGGVAFRLTRVGDPVKIEAMGVEATQRLLETDGPSTASQGVTLDNVRYEADQLHSDQNAIVLRHAGPLTLCNGTRLGGGTQTVPRIALLGTGEQTLELRGVTFGAFGASAEYPIVAQNPAEAVVIASGLVFQRGESDPRNTESGRSRGDALVTRAMN